MHFPDALIYAYDEWRFDRIHGIHTRGEEEVLHRSDCGPNLPSACRYQATRESRFEVIFRLLGHDACQRALVDFGCGKGRVLIMAANRGFRRVYGVEFVREFYEIAKSNVQTLGLQNITLHYGDAANYPIPEDSTVFYFYNPFKQNVFAQVLDRIEQSLNRVPREAFVVYVTPIHAELVKSRPFTLEYSLNQYSMQKINIYRYSPEIAASKFAHIYRSVLEAHS